ncbi:hypothetical protein GGS24DRAFT_429767 [Hypoxylon argillaceum]|nr:hypothetical protein GGS24DRAFT_429767 [Hypoxylon argillaceum]
MWRGWKYWPPPRMRACRSTVSSFPKLDPVAAMPGPQPARSLFENEGSNWCVEPISVASRMAKTSGDHSSSAAASASSFSPRSCLRDRPPSPPRRPPSRARPPPRRPAPIIPPRMMMGPPVEEALRAGREADSDRKSIFLMTLSTGAEGRRVFVLFKSMRSENASAARCLPVGREVISLLPSCTAASCWAVENARSEAAMPSVTRLNSALERPTAECNGWRIIRLN